MRKKEVFFVVDSDDKVKASLALSSGASFEEVIKEVLIGLDLYAMDIDHCNEGLDPQDPLDPDEEEAGMFRCPSCAMPIWHGSGIAGITLEGTCPYCGQKV